MDDVSATIDRLRRVYAGESLEQVYKDFPFAAFFYESDHLILAKYCFQGNNELAEVLASVCDSVETAEDGSSN